MAMNRCKLFKLKVDELKLSELKNKNGALSEHKQELMTGLINLRSKADVLNKSEQGVVSNMKE